ncbi:MAG: SDR family oxidoreductase [Ignavibacteriae bacterium]|nr:SDR family oxidoreductase [Ignavibacteriota bacterium]
MHEKKICVITGCNSGIGKNTAIELAKLGYEIIMLVRDSEKSRNAYEEIKKESGSELLQLIYIDLASLESIKKSADELKKKISKINVLINNAGIFKRKEARSPEGFELTIAVNYLAPFYLTKLLLPLIENAESSRIISLSSELYKNGKVYLDSRFSNTKFDGTKAYADSKLLVIYFTKSLAKRLSTTSVTVNALHPGVIGTDVFREYPKWFSRLLSLFISTPEMGAQPSVYLATSAEVKGLTGKYFYKTKVKETDPVANDEELADNIWEKTEELINSIT